MTLPILDVHVLLFTADLTLATFAGSSRLRDCIKTVRRYIITYYTIVAVVKSRRYVRAKSTRIRERQCGGRDVGSKSITR